MGKDWTMFSNQVLPALKTHGVIKQADYTGSGTQKRYRLGVSLLTVQQAMEQADGSFEKFLQNVGEYVRERRTVGAL